MDPMMGCQMMGGGLMMTAYALTFALLLVGGLWLLGRTMTRRDEGSPPATSALALLEQRFARGEIDRQDFREKKQDLLR